MRTIGSPLLYNHLLVPSEVPDVRCLSRFASCLLPSTLLALLALGGTGHAAAPQFRTLNATDFGKFLAIDLSDARTLNSALQLTLVNLTQYFGAAPSVFNAFADSKDPHAGGATFVATDKGVQVKGLVTCTVGDTSTRVTVVYIRANAPPSEWSRLMHPAGPASETAGSSPTIANGPLRTYNYPDGTGSIGLAEGWSTNAQTGTRMVVLQGPDDAAVFMGGMATVLTPSSTLPHTPGTLVAPFGTPSEVYQALVPQFSQQSAQQGGPTRSIDHLTKVGDQKGVSPNGKTSVLKHGVTETTAGVQKHYQAMTWLEVAPGNHGTFMVLLTQIRAPDAEFEKDKPVMFQMLRSGKENAAAVQAKSSRELAAQNQRFQAQQARMHAQQAANDAQHAQYWATQKANDEHKKAAADKQREQDRSNDNFDEYIRGVRTVEDTQTGVKTSVDLGNVQKIVDDLNEVDPGRYRQIPLRDEVHP